MLNHIVKHRDCILLSIVLFKGEGAGLQADINSEDSSANFTFYPLVTGPVRSWDLQRNHTVLQPFRRTHLIVHIGISVPSDIH